MVCDLCGGGEIALYAMRSIEAPVLEFILHPTWICCGVPTSDTQSLHKAFMAIDVIS